MPGRDSIMAGIGNENTYNFLAISNEITKILL
jgi:hypothetical protein